MIRSLIIAKLGFLSLYSFGQSFNSLATEQVTPLVEVERKLNTQFSYLSKGTFCTRVPQASIIASSETTAAHISSAPQGRLISWNQFLQRNRSWLRTMPVSWETVTGKSPISEEILKNHEEQNHLVVAIFRNGPISVQR